MSLPNLVPRGDNTGSLGTASKRWSTIYAHNLDSSTPQSGIFSGSFSGSFEGDGSGLTGITTTLPSGLVSGSSQISYNGITDVPSGIVSSSTQINSGSFSGSFQGDGSGLTNVVSSSYSVTASHATSVAIDSVDVGDLSATGTPSGITYLRGDNTWATVAGSGDVSKVGTPVDNQVGVWTGNGTLEGNTTFTFDSTTGGVTATSFTGSINTSSIDNFNTEVSRSAVAAGFGGGGTPLPSGLLSGSAQIASDISGSFTSTSASLASSIDTNEGDISNLIADSGSFSTRVTTNETAITSLTVATSSYVLNSQTSSMTVLSSSYATTALSASYAPAGGGPTLRNVGTTSTFATANETINCTGSTFTVNLPTAVGIQGTTYTLVNSGTGIITLDANAAETINGSLTIDLKRQYTSRTVQSDNVGWIVI